MNIDAARGYIAQGFPVFPCCWPDAQGQCACGKHHQERDIGKVPLVTHGLNDATLIELGIREYWGRWPNANIGIAIPKDRFVLDVDIDKGGYESLAKLQERHGILTETKMHTTGSLGQHYFYTTPTPIRNTTRLDGLDGLDVRGTGGYVIAPPSLHRCGRRYTVSELWDGPIMPAPAWLVTLCTKKQVALISNNATENPIPTGARNDTLTRDAGAMRRRGLSQEAIVAALKVENRDRCQPPLTDDEVERIAMSVARYAPEPMRQTPTVGQKFRQGITL